MSFKSKLRIEHIEGTEKYKLFTNLIYITWKKVREVIPKDYASDGHSYPKLLRSFTGSPFATKFPKSSWKHDYDCEMGIKPRKQSDEEYKEAIEDEGGTKFEQNRNYIGVRLDAGWKWISRLWRKK